MLVVGVMEVLKVVVVVGNGKRVWKDGGGGRDIRVRSDGRGDPRN